jgi:hypothetical protein
MLNGILPEKKRLQNFNISDKNRKFQIYTEQLEKTVKKYSLQSFEVVLLFVVVVICSCTVICR